MRLRVATQLDETRVLDVLRADGEATGRQPSKARLAQVRAVLRAPGTLTLVADDDVEVVGMLLAQLVRPDPDAGVRLELGLLCVVPDRRREGVGRSLVQSLLDRFAAVAAWVPDGAAQDLLRSAGFVPSGRTREHEGATAAELLHSPVREG